ncbi:hypothetical protein PENTCL1PPCAC_8551, partial [Pristionchus entomophagus]
MDEIILVDILNTGYNLFEPSLHATRLSRFRCGEFAEPVCEGVIAKLHLYVDKRASRFVIYQLHFFRTDASQCFTIHINLPSLGWFLEPDAVIANNVLMIELGQFPYFTKNLVQFSISDISEYNNDSLHGVYILVVDVFSLENASATSDSQNCSRSIGQRSTKF